MEFLTELVDFFWLMLGIVLNLDQHLGIWVEQYGPWIYAVLFLIVFAETGFVVTPFLPGDSLLFVAGGLAALGGLDIWILASSLFVAAVAGNTLNYHIGHYLGPRVFQWEKSRIFNRSALLKTHAFYERHGGKALVISRFMPILRTFAPFVAGIGAMPYPRFMMYNVIGGLGWVVSLTAAGYWFGNLPWIQQNLSLVILSIIIISLLPALVAYLRGRKS